jgi:hypothetical protein
MAGFRRIVDTSGTGCVLVVMAMMARVDVGRARTSGCRACVTVTVIAVFIVSPRRVSDNIWVDFLCEFRMSWIFGEMFVRFVHRVPILVGTRSVAISCIAVLLISPGGVGANTRV